MGYYSTLSGHLDIEPPLSAVELRSCEFRPGRDDVYVQVEEIAVDTDEGTLIRTSGPVLAVYGDQTKAYGLEERVRVFVATYAEHHVCNGVITVEGEANTDVWRLVVIDNVVTKETAVMTWPDGTVHEGTR